ncbi:methyltransferase domain-containing protein [bacterium]|nr:methyltransferase domain-containing protein [bacterium]
MSFQNVYEDNRRAAAYDKLEFPGTYYLAFRDIPELIARHVTGKNALDFGCGAGRSTCFLKKLGLDAIGVDISEDMLKHARARDPQGRYLLSSEDDLSVVSGLQFDVILSAFTFDNIPTAERKLKLFTELRNSLAPNGKIVNLVSSPEIYKHEWASFTTCDFPENKLAQTGDRVKIIMKDVEDPRPVEDILWSHESYLDVFSRAGLRVIETLSPLARPDEPFQWITETTTAPWTIYLLASDSPSGM